MIPKWDSHTHDFTVGDSPIPARCNQTPRPLPNSLRRLHFLALNSEHNSESNSKLPWSSSVMNLKSGKVAAVTSSVEVFCSSLCFCLGSEPLSAWFKGKHIVICAASILFLFVGVLYFDTCSILLRCQSHDLNSRYEENPRPPTHL